MKNKMKLTKWTGGAMLAGASLLTASAVAQNAESLEGGVPNSVPEQEQAASQQQGATRQPVSVVAGVSEQFNSDIDNGGSFSVTRVKVGAALPIKLADDFQLGTSLRYGYDNYNFDNITSPWENINTLSAASILQWRNNETWSTYGGGFVKMSAESGSALNRGTTGGGLVGFNYKVNQDLSLGLGIAVASQLEDNAAVLPLITAKWKFADNWRLDVGLTDVATAGYGAELKWLFDKEFDFGLGVQFHKSRFRINGNTAYPGSNDGIGQEEAATIYLNSNWHVNSNFDLTAFFGFTAGGKLKLEDNSGNKLTESDYDPAAILGLSAVVRF